MSNDTHAPETEAALQEIRDAVTALRNGCLLRELSEEYPGTLGEIARTLNEHVRQMNAFASEMTRISREVGLEGVFGGQAEVPELEGTWKDLVDNLNYMGARLTVQIRNMEQVTRALTAGSTDRRVDAPAQGETRQLQAHINTLADLRAQPSAHD